jgi:hypothetical protein
MKYEQLEERAIDLTKTAVSEPKWLTKDVKKVFRHEVHGFSNGLRLTKLVQRNKKL